MVKKASNNLWMLPYQPFTYNQQSLMTAIKKAIDFYNYVPGIVNTVRIYVGSFSFSALQQEVYKICNESFEEDFENTVSL